MFLRKLMLIAVCLLITVNAQDTTRVLVLSNSDSFNEDVFFDFVENIPDLHVTTLNILDSLPDLAALLSYDVVLLGGNLYNQIENTYDVGNILSAFVLAGGYLVLTDSYWYWRSDAGNESNWGALENIDPLLGWREVMGDARMDSASIVDHPLTESIDTLETYYYGGPDSVRENTTVLAWWDNGNPLIAFNNTIGWITAINYLPVDDYYFYDKVANNYNELWNNVLKWKRTNIENPEISVGPLSFDQFLAPGDSITSALNISNIAEGTLAYLINLSFDAQGTTKSALVKERHFKNVIKTSQVYLPTSGSLQGRGLPSETLITQNEISNKSSVLNSDWQLRRSMMYARAQAGVEAHPNGSIYVFGGYTPTLEIYNIATDQWIEGQAMPFDVRGIATGVDNNGYIYAFDPWFADTVSYKYHPDSGIWQATSSIVPVWEPGFTKGTDGLFYIFGGEEDKDTLGYIASERVQIYDPIADSLRFGAPMPTPRMQLGVAEFGGLIYTFGGRLNDGDPVTGVVEVYDPESNTWSSADSMPTPRNQFAIAVGPDNKIYTIGGKDAYGNNREPFFDIVEIYDPATDSWEDGPSLPFPMGEIRATVFNGAIYIFGGSNGSILNTNFVLHPGGSWIRLSSMQGMLGLGETDISDVIFNASDLPDDTYYATINIYSNDLDSPITRIPVSLTIDPLASSIEVNKDYLAKEYVLSQNYPNPFNPVTTIEYTIPNSSHVSLKVFNVLGEEITNLVNNYQQRGLYKLEWNASALSSGVYFYKLETKHGTKIKKLILVK